MTTDTKPKTAVVSRDGFTVGGMAKGAGMIHPQLATMLAVVTTDYPLEPGEAKSFLAPAVDASFNCISVDGECSTNDAVVLLANGARRSSGRRRRTRPSRPRCCRSAPTSRSRSSRTARARRCCSRSRSTALHDDHEAEAIARRIATSPLVKTAAFGRDANWGRVLPAAGSAPFNGGYAPLDVSKLSLAFNGTQVFQSGAPLGVEPDFEGARLQDRARARARPGQGQLPRSDLTYDYVRINADYRS